MYTATIFRLVFARLLRREVYFSDEGEKDDSSDDSSSSDEEEEATENDSGRNKSKKLSNQDSEGDDDVPMKITNNKNKSFDSGKLLKYAFFFATYWFYQGPLADMDLSLHDFSFCGWPQVV